MTVENYLKTELYDLIKTDDKVFDFLQEASLDGIWYWDLKNLENEWMSPAFWRLFSVDPSTKDHLSSEWQDIIHPDDLKTALENFNQHLENPAHPYDQIVRYRHVNGSVVTVRCRGLVIRDDAGKPMRMLGAHNDLTELMHVKEELAQANMALEDQLARAEELVELKSNFLSIISHEVRTPMNAILGLLQVIEMSTTEEKQKMRAAKALEACERLMSLLTKVLEAARFEQSTVEAQFEDVKLSDIRSYVDTLIQGEIAQSEGKVAVQIDWSDDIPATFWTDNDMISKVLANLISNAFKFTESGQIDLRVSGLQDGPRGGLAIEVSDTGIGIDAEHQGDIFKPFQQVDASMTRRVDGSGLGLSITKQLVKTLQGNIRVNSQKGQGASFHVALPNLRTDDRADKIHIARRG